MKTSSLFILILFIGGGITAYAAFLSNQQQAEQISSYETHVQQLLSEIERSSVRRLDADKQIDQLGRELTELRSQLTSINSQLQVAQQQVNPEYEALEQRIRREVRTELQSQRAPTTIASRTELLRQMSQLDPVEMSELMTLQAQFGGFLQALNVDDDRLEVIVDGLSNMVAEQNQARRDMMMQLQQQDGNPRQIRRQIQTISGPETQSEALSFILTDDEMALFNEYQANQPQQAFTRSVIRSVDGDTGTAGAVFIGTPNGIQGEIIKFDVLTDKPN